MKKNIVIAHDVGTSAVKSALIDIGGKILAREIHSYKLHTPKPGWAEQDPMDYWKAIVANTTALIQRIENSRISGMIFTTQAMGIIPIDKSGKVLYRNISWVDGRAQKQARWMMSLLGGKKVFNAVFGYDINGKDVLPKLRWLKQNEPVIYKNTFKFLDVNGFLRFKATGKIAAEWSGASSWGFNTKTKNWEKRFFKVVGIDTEKLPDLIKSTDVVGTLTAESATELGLPSDIKVFGGCDDSQSAAIGAACIKEGSVFAYIGTAAQLGVTTSKHLKFKNGAACIQGADPKSNLLIAVTETAGNNVEWLIQKFFKHELETVGKEKIYDILTKEAEKIPAGSDHLIFTPWFLGERCPVTSTTTRATIFNLGMEHSRGHFIRALFEGIGFNFRWILENYKKDYGFDISEFRFIGGGSQNEIWMQNIADITGRKVITVKEPTMAGCIGAALCTFVGAGLLKDFSEAEKLIKIEKTYHPNSENRAIYDKLFVDYKNVFMSLKKTYKTANQKRFLTL